MATPNISSLHVQIHGREERKGVLTSLVVIFVAKFCFYAIFGHLTYVLQHDMDFHSVEAVLMTLSLTGSVYVLSIIGGCLGQACGFHKIICVGLAFQLLGGIFLIIATVCKSSLSHDQEKAMLATCIACVMICDILIYPTTPVHGSMQYMQNRQGAVDTLTYFAWFYVSINLGALLSFLVMYLINRFSAEAGYASYLTVGILMTLGSLMCLVLMFSSRRNLPSVDGNRLALLFKCQNNDSRHVLLLVTIFPVFMFAHIMLSQMDTTYGNQGHALQITTRGGAEIPMTINSMANAVSVIISVLIYMLARKCLVERGVELLSPFKKLVIGFSITILGTLSAAVLEFVRFDRILENKTPPPLLWQIPQYALGGIGEIFIYITGYHFVFTESPEGLEGFLMSFLTLLSGVGTFISYFLVDQFHKLSDNWYPSDLKKGHLGNFLLLLAGIMLIPVVSLLVCCRRYIYLRDRTFGGYQQIDGLTDIVSSIEDDDSVEITEQSLDVLPISLTKRMANMSKNA